jgi:osmoprotectant transport system ATP-binding protein
LDATPYPMIRFDKVRKEYADGTVAVEGLSLDVLPGELVVLVGPSGCGKTTSMKMVNRLIEPTSGQILVDGTNVLEEDPTELRRRIGYVIQNVGLFPHRTINENVATVPSLLGWDKARSNARVHELLDLVGLDPVKYGPRYPHELSGGQRQRVGVARALAADPPVLLMDEPFGAVDPIARARLQDEFQKLQRSLGTTVVFVTHDIGEAVLLGDRIAVMSTGGILEQYATPVEILSHPATPYVADFVGSDRALRQLTVLSIPDEAIDRSGRTNAGAATVPRDASLEMALAALLHEPSGVVGVLEADGRALGTLSLAAVHAAVQRASAGAAPAGHDAQPAEASAEPR